MGTIGFTVLATCKFGWKLGNRRLFDWVATPDNLWRGIGFVVLSHGVAGCFILTGVSFVGWTFFALSLGSSATRGLELLYEGKEES